MIIECPRCDSKVDAKILAERNYRATDETDPFKNLFLECPVCKNCLLATQELIRVGEEEWEYSKPERLWPGPTENLHSSIPHLTRHSIEQAKICFKAQAYPACAVMCGRAIEAICVEHKTQSKNLGAGLRELRNRKIIDQRLFDWGEALREKRNIGAHANEEEISREDARDVLDFAIAICEYVFVLTAKYQAFQARQKKKASSKLPPRRTPPPPPPSAPGS